MIPVLLIAALDLSCNTLSSLPEEFGNLTKLITIDLSENEFKSFPDILRRLQMLTTVNLHSNKITDINTEEYSSVQCLEILILTNNPLREEVKTLLQSVVRIKIIT